MALEKHILPRDRIGSNANNRLPHKMKEHRLRTVFKHAIITLRVKISPSTMKFVVATLLGIFATAVGAVDIVSLTMDNYEELTNGKTVFIDFFNPGVRTISKSDRVLEVYLKLRSVV